MVDEGFSPPQCEPNVERWGDENETLDDRLAEKVPDETPGSAYGNPEGQPSLDDTRVGRLTAEDEGLREDTKSEMVAEDSGFAGGASSAEEAAMHFDDGLDAERRDDGVDG